MKLRTLLILVLCAAAAGCTALLPRASTDTPSTFRSYAEAQTAAQRITAFETRTSELRGLGFDPDEGMNVTVIPYPEIVARLAPYSGVALDGLDPGIRQCIMARAQCQAYLFRFARQDRKREGNFWADFLNVQRITNITGWWFETLVVVSDGTVLFRNFAGQAHTDRVEKETNPLGPFQSGGEGAGTILFR